MVAFEKGEGESWYEGVEIGVALVGSNSPCAVFASQVGLDNDPGVCPKLFPRALDVVRKSRRSKWAALKLEARCKAQTAGNWKQVRIVVALWQAESGNGDKLQDWLQSLNTSLYGA
jgi:hypothetical protein